MRKISAIIVGIYGMDFDHMPELRRLWGYPAVVLGMAGPAILLHRLFKRLNWL
jgi:magnesium transporter